MPCPTPIQIEVCENNEEFLKELNQKLLVIKHHQDEDDSKIREAFYEELNERMLAVAIDEYDYGQCDDNLNYDN
jgi:hypothetical protein